MTSPFITAIPSLFTEAVRGLRTWRREHTVSPSEVNYLGSTARLDRAVALTVSPCVAM